MSPIEWPSTVSALGPQRIAESRLPVGVLERNNIAAGYSNPLSHDRQHRCFLKTNNHASPKQIGKILLFTQKQNALRRKA
jgi:hypothetical protein